MMEKYVKMVILSVVPDGSVSACVSLIFCRVMIGQRLCREQYLFLKLREGGSGFKQDGKGLERYGMVKEAKDVPRASLIRDQRGWARNREGVGGYRRPQRF